MKKTLLILCMLFFAIHASMAQIAPFYPMRTMGVLIQDQHLRANKSLWLPYTNSTTPSLLQVDSIGSNFQLLNNGRLVVSKGSGIGFNLYPNLDEITALIGSSGFVQNTMIQQPSSNFNISGSGTIGATLNVNTINNTASSNNSQIVLATTGNVISRNIADANHTLKVNNVNASSTGLILQLQSGGSGVINFSKAGNTLTQSLTINTPPTTSAGSYEILTRNTSGGSVEKVSSSLYAPVTSPSFTGTPLSVTPASNINTTQIVNGAWVNTYYTPLTRTLIAGFGIAALGDLSANRTITVDTTIIRSVANSLSKAQVQTQLNTKQATLVSATNIKTVNSTTILGSGDLSTNVFTGWASYSDNVYTVGSPFSISSGVTSTLPNNAATVINTQLPTGVSSFYNSGTNKITPQNDGDYYVFAIRFKAKTSASNGGYLDFGIDIGGGMGIVFPETKPFLKGAATEQAFSITCGGYSAATFLANGGLVKITAGNGTVTIYDISYQISRTHKAK